jgi:hypothetical protein
MWFFLAHIPQQPPKFPSFIVEAIFHQSWVHNMDPGKDYHERMQRLTQAFAEMTQEFTASLQELSETTQELSELMISEKNVVPQATAALMKEGDNDHKEGRSKNSQRITMPIQRTDIDNCLNHTAQQSSVSAKRSVKAEGSVKVERCSPDLMTAPEEQNAATEDFSPGTPSPDIKMSSDVKAESTESKLQRGTSSRKRKRTPSNFRENPGNATRASSVKPEDTADEQEQLCFQCFAVWDTPLNPGEKLLDCQFTPGNPSSCGTCADKNAACELVSIPWPWHRMLPANRDVAPRSSCESYLATKA